MPLCPAENSYGVRWQGDQIVFSTGRRILTVPAAGGPPRELISVAKDMNEQLTQPQILADGRAIVYTVRSGKLDEGQIVVQQPIEGGPRRVLVEGVLDGRVLPTGHLVWVRDSTLYAQVLNPETLQLEGGPVTLVEGLRAADASGAGQFSISDSGTLVFSPGVGNQVQDLIWVDRSGRRETTGAPARMYAYPRISPDRTKIAASTTDGDADIWLWDIARKIPTKLTSGPEQEGYPIWTPDSRFVIYRSNPGGGDIDLFRRAADGTGGLDLVSKAPETQTPLMVLSTIAEISGGE